MKNVRYYIMPNALLKSILLLGIYRCYSSITCNPVAVSGHLLTRLRFFCLALIGAMFLVACGGGGGGGSSSESVVLTDGEIIIDGEIGVEGEAILLPSKEGIFIELSINRSQVSERNITQFIISYTNTKTGEQDSRNLSIVDFEGNHSLESDYFLDELSINTTYNITLYTIDGEGNRRELVTGGPLHVKVEVNTDGDSLVDRLDPDDDGDDIADEEDNCRLTANSGQEDNDTDGAGDACDSDDDNDGILDTEDNCRLTANSGQEDNDTDGAGDACDSDDDGDDIADEEDNCRLTANSGQEDNDTDGAGDACDSDDDNDGILDTEDNCPLLITDTQTDTDGDEIGDACDPDDDNDGTLDTEDNCPLLITDTQTDTDGDEIGDACDPDDDNDRVADEDEVAEECRLLEDCDGDGYNDNVDNCILVVNSNQLNTDGDDKGDACDDDKDGDDITNDLEHPGCSLQADCDNDNVSDGDELISRCQLEADCDNDNVSDGVDNCPLAYNPNQNNTCEWDIDGDNHQNSCDITNSSCVVDNCPTVTNPDQIDTDNDTQGDACDEDDDNDRLLDTVEREQLRYNQTLCSLKQDCDEDDVLDIVDNCPINQNTAQSNVDNDTQGDACDDDIDNDGIFNDVDLCPLVYNPAADGKSQNRTACFQDEDGDDVDDRDDNCPNIANNNQLNTDGDEMGDVCDNDDDGDGIVDERDNCPLVANVRQEDEDGDRIGTECDDTDDRRDIFSRPIHLHVSYHFSLRKTRRGLLILGDGSGGGSPGSLRRFSSGVDSWNEDLAVGGHGGGNDDIDLEGSSGSDVIFGDGSGGGAGAPFNIPAVNAPKHSIEGGNAGGGNDHIRGGAGSDIIFGDGFKGGSSEGRDRTDGGNGYCGQRGVCAGGDGGYGGGGGGGANLRRPAAQTGTFRESGGKGGLGAGDGGGVAISIYVNNHDSFGSRYITNYRNCYKHSRFWFWRQGQGYAPCGAFGDNGYDSAFGGTYTGGFGTVYDADRAGSSSKRINCFSYGKVWQCHLSGGGGGGLGARGGSAPTSPHDGWVDNSIRAADGSSEQFMFELDSFFWGKVLEDTDFDGHNDDDRVWGSEAQQMGGGNDIINGGPDNDIIITGRGRDTVVFDLDVSASNVRGVTDFEIDRVLDFDMGDESCNRDKLHITRKAADGIRQTVKVDDINNLPSDILIYDGSDSYGPYVGIIITDGFIRADKTRKLAALFLYDHHKDREGTARDRDQSASDLRGCHFR